ncbi:MAG: hypothetical protein HY569_01840 [Candidatus Magasanikbacteria bacterium]|nr:hypothetical protein [Candidatus Magasanikbacteria bacterium]
MSDPKRGYNPDEIARETETPLEIARKAVDSTIANISQELSTELHQKYAGDKEQVASDLRKYNEEAGPEGWKYVIIDNSSFGEVGGGAIDLGAFLASKFGASFEILPELKNQGIESIRKYWKILADLEKTSEKKRIILTGNEAVFLAAQNTVYDGKVNHNEMVFLVSDKTEGKSGVESVVMKRVRLNERGARMEEWPGTDEGDFYDWKAEALHIR